MTETINASDYWSKQQYLVSNRSLIATFDGERNVDGEKMLVDIATMDSIGDAQRDSATDLRRRRAVSVTVRATLKDQRGTAQIWV